MSGPGPGPVPDADTTESLSARVSSSSGAGDPAAPERRALRVAAVDDHPMVLHGLAALLAEMAPDIDLVEIATSVPEVLDGSASRADVVLLDLHLGQGGDPGDEGEQNVRTLVDAGAAVLVYTSEERPIPLRRAIAAGASGVLLKIDPVERVVEAVRTVADGGVVCSGSLAQALLLDDVVRLSPREVEVIRAVSDGLPAELIATSLFITEGTVREHIRRAFRKFRDAGLEVRNAHGLVSQARSHGYVD